MTTTLARIAANKRNALASTGPRTLVGKRRSSANARRHGLAVSLKSDFTLQTEAQKLAQLIAGENASPRRTLLAGRIAEAQIDVIRARNARRDLINKLGSAREGPASWDGIGRELHLIDRYERRALSRRKAAFRDLQSFR